MRTLKLTSIAFLGMLLMLGACKKDDATVKASNSFVVNNKSYTTDGAWVFVGTIDTEAELTLSKVVSTINGNDYNFVYFNFVLNALPTSGTFTYKNYDDPTFDPKKNFSDVVLGYDLNSDDDFDKANFDSEKANAEGSTITISKSGDNYTFNYTLKFKDNSGKTTTITGQYTGRVN